MSKKKYFLSAIIISLFLFNITHAQNSLKLTKQQWLEDLHYAAKTLIDKHPDIFYRISEDDFKRTIVRAEQKIKRSQADEECLIAIRQVVASIRDGHTRLGANNLPGFRDIYPVRLYEFSDGIFITGIAEKYKKYVGAKVIKIGLFSAEEAFNRAGTLAFADNEFSKKNQVPLIVIACKLAYGLGITETTDKLSLVVETTKGSHDEIILLSVTPPKANNMLRGLDSGPDGIPFASAFYWHRKGTPFIYETPRWKSQLLV
ncbi:MAG: hypothetical protein JSV17_16685 [Candidatus Aminicenantes bacterium]|nr:MAG: hypothetical protein JSV17_16685 [Candidatus Aminicenantes bacterium]